MVRIQNLPGAQRILDIAENYMGINRWSTERGMILDAKAVCSPATKQSEVGLTCPVRQAETITTVVSTVWVKTGT